MWGHTMSDWTSEPVQSDGRLSIAMAESAISKGNQPGGAVFFLLLKQLRALVCIVGNGVDTIGVARG